MIMRIRTKQKKVNGLKLKMSCLLKKMGIKTSLIDKYFRKKFSIFITLDEEEKETGIPVKMVKQERAQGGCLGTESRRKT